MSEKEKSIAKVFILESLDFEDEEKGNDTNAFRYTSSPSPMVDILQYSSKLLLRLVDVYLIPIDYLSACDVYLFLISIHRTRYVRARIVPAK